MFVQTCGHSAVLFCSDESTLGRESLQVVIYAHEVSDATVRTN
jgi:hypothetical protein